MSFSHYYSYVESGRYNWVEFEKGLYYMYIRVDGITVYLGYVRRDVLGKYVYGSKFLGDIKSRAYDYLLDCKEDLKFCLLGSFYKEVSRGEGVVMYEF